MDTGTWIALAAVLVSVVALLLGSHRDTKSDAAQDAAGAARMETKLDTISAGVEDIRVEIRSTRERVNTLSERVSAVESSCKSAHHRLDQLENRHD